MKREELVAIIRETAGSEIAAAVGRIQERRQDLAPAVFADRDDEKARRDAIVKSGSMLLGWTAQALMKGNKEAAFKTMPAAIKEHVERALTAGNLDAGGAFFSPEHSQEIIDLLAPRTVVRRRVQTVVDLSAGQLDMGRLTADATVSWGGEIEAIRESTPATGNVVLRAFQEKALVPFSNTFLRRGGPRVANVVQRSVLRSASIGEDDVFLTSPGTQYRPKGLLYWAPSGNKFQATTFAGTDAQKLAIVTTDLGTLFLKLEQADVPMTGATLVFSPRTKQYLMTCRDGNGNFAFRPEMLTGTLWGVPFDVTTRISNLLGVDGTGTGVTSLVMLYDADEFMLGQGAALQIDMSDQGTFIDADGNVVSLYQRNMSALRLINEVDFVPQHEQAVAVITGVAWQ